MVLLYGVVMVLFGGTTTVVSRGGGADWPLVEDVQALSVNKAAAKIGKTIILCSIIFPIRG